jgi:transcriptional regulator with XRE-family HTH domain
MRESAARRFAKLLRKLRVERGMSMKHLADEAGLHPSAVTRAETGKDACLSTWEKLFFGLGYELLPETQEYAEEVGELLQDEAQRRQDRILDGLCAGKRRWY